VVGQFIGSEANNLLVFGGKRLVAAIGVQDLIIVDADDALLVCSKAHEQQVREMVEKLKSQGRDDLV
jgi:mannose-1-phosphate guanylyltransferase